jgi:dephospho-CoA kinase
MFAGKPIIGIAGGIGSGKSFVARLFAEAGCVVIDSDEQIRQAYRDPKVRQVLQQWWGPQVLRPDGEIDKALIARKVFGNPQERSRLEGLLHPMVAQARQKEMDASAGNAQVLAFVWDTPLLFESGLNKNCDAVVFVDAPEAVRLQRIAARGWDQAQLKSREKSQMPLDKKREISDYVISNTAGADQVRVQVRDVLSRILAAASASKKTGSQ